MFIFGINDCIWCVGQNESPRLLLCQICLNLSDMNKGFFNIYDQEDVIMLLYVCLWRIDYTNIFR